MPEAAHLLDEIKHIGRHDGSLRCPAPGEQHRAVLKADGVNHFGEVCPCFAHLHGVGNQVHAYMVTDCRKSLLVQLASLYNSVMSNAIQTAASEAHCLRCGRKLTSTKSIADKFGKGCAAKIRQAARETALEGLNDKQRDKALEIVSDGGAVPSNREGVWHVTSGDGSQAYLTTGDGHCNCKWGLRRVSADTKVCAHVGAVRLVALRPSRRSMTKAA
jgi:hypothetical protein